VNKQRDDDQVRATRTTECTRTTRREALCVLGTAGLTVVAGCGGEDRAAAAATGAGSGGAGTAGSGGGAQASTAAGGAQSSGAGGAGGGENAGGAGGEGGAPAADTWASGGTAMIGDDYPDPFSDGLGTMCSITCAETLGPCHAQTLVRKDISEGRPGLPVRLALLIVDESCQPVEDPEVEIWHTSHWGVYSGDDATDYCTGFDPEAIENRFFRGQQTGGADGRVDFDTCFPGAYESRTIHIHFIVRVGGKEYLTSQLYFQQSLIEEICGTHPDYAQFGAPSISNDDDGYYSPDAELDVKMMVDGVMMASKVIVLRDSLSESLCYD
jgi:hypothetical protein